MFELPAPLGMLFDVDGTLLVDSSDHLGALLSVLGERVGSDLGVRMVGERPHLAGWDATGRIDAEVVRHFLGVPNDARSADLTEVMAAYTDEFASRLDAGVATAGAPVPGVAGVLDRLCASGVGLGLATGNAADVARRKLEAHDLAQHFEFGPDRGFGDAWRDRTQLVERAREGLRTSRGTGVWLVGDTVADMRAAVANSLIAIGVESGGDTRARLLGAGATAVIATAADLGRLVTAAR